MSTHFSLSGRSPILVLFVGLIFAVSACDDDGSGSDGPDLVDDASQQDVVDDTMAPDMGEDVTPDTSEDPVADPTPDTAPGSVAPGGLCNCDSDCQDVEGHGGICVYGICMTQASADCSAGGSQAECADGSRCWGLTGHTGSICWPDCDTYTCEGSCDSDGSCVMTESTACNPECGSYCESGGGTGDMGGPCDYDEDCGDGQCYQGEGYVDGYCLIWGCSTPGEACGDGGICVGGLGSDGSNICMGSCEGGCREGYACTEDDDGVAFCIAYCESSDDCPDSYACNADDVCVVDYTCSPQNPVSGECPDGQICDDGTCVPFTCDHNISEPNETSDAATPITGPEAGHQICDDDHDWFSFTPSATDKLYVVGVASEWGSGDLDVDLTLADGTTYDRTRLLPDDYHDENPRGPMDLEATSIVGDADAETFKLHVYGASGAVNNYDLFWEEIDWADGLSCPGAGFAENECRALTATGYFDSSLLVPFPVSHENDPYIGDGVFFETGNTSSGRPGYNPSSARWAKRELVMAVRYAIHRVQEAYPGTGPLGIGEVSMPDGTTPWGHPNGTHYYGSNIDTAYYILPEYQRDWGNMVYRQICNDATSLNDYSAVATDPSAPGYGECVAGSEDTHIVDVPRTALFLAALAETNRIRVYGVDTAVEADLDAEFARLRDEEIISSSTYTNATRRMATANDDGSWIWHFHHIHISFCVEDC